MRELENYGIIPKSWGIDELQGGMVLTLITDVYAIPLELTASQAEQLKQKFEQARLQVGRQWQHGMLCIPVREQP